MKKVEIEIPEGKKVEWVNGVLTLIDDKPEDIKERIKTFEDAVMILGNDNQAVIDYFAISETDCSNDILAFAKLRVIAEALNEEWKPTFYEDEYRFYAWFYIYTESEYEELDDEKKKWCRVVGRSKNLSYASGGLVFASADYASSYSSSDNGSRLAFKTRELAQYCSKHLSIFGQTFYLHN